MTICLMCDLHLPFEKNALQYDVLDWAIANIIQKKPACVIYAGDVTCDGNLAAYDAFIERMHSLEIPFLYIPGNSDLRCPQSADIIRKKASVCKNIISGKQIFMLNDCDGTVCQEDYHALLSAQDGAILCMHHPITAYGDPIQKWLSHRENATVFFGHLHKSYQDGSLVSLQAMDPDKAIGENPCITYFDTETKELEKAYYNCPMPKDICTKLGVSCYRVEEDIKLAISHKLKCLELRPNILDCDCNLLCDRITAWRTIGGQDLSIHLPEIEYKNGEVILSEKLDNLLSLADLLHADRLTQHVPKVSVKDVRSDKNALAAIASALAEKINALPNKLTLGVENMHMTAGEKPDDTRRFGYIPEECLEFMHLLSQKCKGKVGINFDIGHARNNMPFSQKYQISTWLALVGKHIVGYHIHQVTEKNGVFENHMPITEPYGRLISYASFFKNWELGNIRHAPVILEMRPREAYAQTLKVFHTQN